MQAISVGKEESSISFSSWILGFLLFSLIPAFYVWNNPLDTIFTFLLSAMVLVDTAQNRTSRDRFRLMGIGLYLLIFMVFIIRSDFTILGIIKKLFVIPLLFARRDLLEETFRAFVRIFAIVMSVSLVVYFVVVLLGINLPRVQIQPLNDLKTGSYYLYPFLILTDARDMIGFSFRFHGFFDEPGVVGTISAIILVIERFNLRSKFNIVILLAGIFSFSMFFYLTCFIAILLTAPNKVKIGTLVLVAVLLYLFRDNEIVDQLIFSRFTDDEGLWSLYDNRNTGVFNLYYESFSKSSAFWTGLGAGSAANIGEGGSSYKMLVYDYGMIFFVLYVAIYYFFVFGIFKGWKTYFAFSLILLGTMYQRPFVGEITYTFLMLVSTYLIAERYRSFKSKNSIATYERRATC